MHDILQGSVICTDIQVLSQSFVHYQIKLYETGFFLSKSEAVRKFTLSIELELMMCKKEKVSIKEFSSIK